MLGQAESRNRLNRIYIYKIIVARPLRTHSKKQLPTFPLPVTAIMFSISCLNMQLLLVLSFSSCFSILPVQQTIGEKTEQTRNASDYLVHKTPCTKIAAILAL